MRKKKKSSKLFVTFLFILSLLYFVLYYIYVTYIDVKIESKYEIQRTESKNYLQTVEEVTENSQTIADMIETVSSSVVGISKLKNKNIRNNLSYFGHSFCNCRFVLLPHAISLF